ncbi:J domain-containing protein [Ramlibacter sp. PS4R-6]|uniref:J domain-containing protein n=1 Tax=Ramlibacter sp. PS4R-6 TaxID=3133438 RepID=UPI0030AF7B5C
MSARALTYYDVLQVERTAAPDRVRVAYRQLARRYHPDHAPGDVDAHRLMAELNAAYAVLSDPEQRALYDERIDAIRAARERARASFIARLEDNGARWPWFLLFATMALSGLCVGVSVYTNYVPSAATPIVKAFSR